jgi:hypothetical protein
MHCSNHGKQQHKAVSCIFQLDTLEVPSMADFLGCIVELKHHFSLMADGSSCFVLLSLCRHMAPPVLCR